jgi:hypothetical protein
LCLRADRISPTCKSVQEGAGYEYGRGQFVTFTSEFKALNLAHLEAEKPPDQMAPEP